MPRLSVNLYAVYLSTATMYVGCVLKGVAAQDYIVKEQSGYHFNQLGSPAPPQAIAGTCPWDDVNLQRWEDPGSWATGTGTVPSAGDDVTLSQNTRYLLSTSISIGKLTIPATSSLVFANTNLELVTTGVQVLGSLHAGSINCQITSEIAITLTGVRRLGEDAYYKGIVVEETGTIDMHGVRYRVTWTRLAANAAAQDSEIILQDCVDDWPIGSEIVVTTTEFKNSREHNFNEVAIIQGAGCFDVTMDGNIYTLGRVTLESPLAHRHYAGQQEYQAEVALLSRTITVRGDDQSSPTDIPLDGTVCEYGSDNYSNEPCSRDYYLTGFGGHMMAMGELSQARISSVELYRMGQTNIVGRYPMHLHLMHENGDNSYVEDCAVHESYYRGIVIHGTHGTRVSRNVAFDVTGHCYYMESGFEERNEISYNLGAHVHPIGWVDMHGQNNDNVDQSDVLPVPADTTASPFYITNLHNRIIGNAATGGMFGFAMVNLPRVIGVDRHQLDPWDEVGEALYSPMDRATLEFNGNSARSAGYFYNLGPCFYVGGFLQEKTSEHGYALQYNPGRHITGPNPSPSSHFDPENRRRSSRTPTAQDGSLSTNLFTNSKAALCNVAGGDWNKRSDWTNLDMHDIGNRGFNAFGEVTFTNISAQCRSTNGLQQLPVTNDRPKMQEKRFDDNFFVMFRAYDTNQKHVITNWRVTDCGSPQSSLSNDPGRAAIWSIPHNQVMQFQLVMRNIVYTEPRPPDHKLVSYETAVPGKYGGFFGNFLDADGSLTSRATATIAGSAGMVQSIPESEGTSPLQLPANMWWKLSGLDGSGTRGLAVSDARCSLHSSWEYPMWACDQGTEYVGTIRVDQGDGALNNNANKHYEQAGAATHWGDAIESGVPLPYDSAVTGPFDHSVQGGWFLQYFTAADSPQLPGNPAWLRINSIQIPDSKTLMVALSYPASSTFAITGCIERSNHACESDEDKQHQFTSVATVADVRRDPIGDKYYFDGSYLYLRVVSVAQESGMKLYRGAGDSFNYRSSTGGPEPTQFFPDQSGIPLKSKARYSLQIHVDDCGADGSDYCAAGTIIPPPLSTGSVHHGTTMPATCAGFDCSQHPNALHQPPEDIACVGAVCEPDECCIDVPTVRPNLLTNPGAEEAGQESWSFFTSTGTAERSSDTWHSGGHSFLLGGEGSPRISQTIVLDGDVRRVRVSGWFRTVGAASADLKFRAVLSSGRTSSYSHIYPGADIADWTFLSTEAEYDENIVELLVRMQLGENSPDSNFWIDDLSVVDISSEVTGASDDAAPTPSPESPTPTPSPSADTPATGSPCFGLSTAECDANDYCEKAGFSGAKYCAEAPAQAPRVDLNGTIHIAIDGDDFRSCGTAASPCGTLEYAARMAAPGDTICIHEGVYEQSTAELTLVGDVDRPISVVAYENDLVTFRAATRIDQHGKNVSLWGSGSAIVCSSCHHVIFDGFILHGRTEVLTFEDAVANHYWSDERIEYVGYSGIQIIDDSTHITVQNMVIHDLLCSGIYLKGTRYATVRHNIIYRIVHHCMVGGGGVMYGGIGQVPGDYGNSDPDDPSLWRMDFYGNLIFDVEQRLYSWVKSDNTLTMHIDEGKTLDTQGASNDRHARFRISENIVLFPGVIGIKFKRLPGGVVTRNSIYVESDKPRAEGVRGTHNLGNEDFVFHSNAVHAGPGKTAVDLRGVQPHEGDPVRFHSNYLAGGGELAAGAMRPSTLQAVVDLGPNGTLFRDPMNSDFAVDGPEVPSDIGVSAPVFNQMMTMATRYGVQITPTCFRQDHERTIQMIITAAPPNVFSSPTFERFDADHADITWTASSDWIDKYRDYRNGLIMHLPGQYAAELLAWSHDPVQGFIDRATKFSSLDCSLIASTSYCSDVRGCICGDQDCNTCITDADFDPIASINHGNQQSVVPCVEDGEELIVAATLRPPPTRDVGAGQDGDSDFESSDAPTTVVPEVVEPEAEPGTIPEEDEDGSENEQPPKASGSSGGPTYRFGMLVAAIALGVEANDLSRG